MKLIFRHECVITLLVVCISRQNNKKGLLIYALRVSIYGISSAHTMYCEGGTRVTGSCGIYCEKRKLKHSWAGLCIVLHVHVYE